MHQLSRRKDTNYFVPHKCFFIFFNPSGAGRGDGYQGMETTNNFFRKQLYDIEQKTNFALDFV